MPHLLTRTRLISAAVVGVLAIGGVAAVAAGTTDGTSSRYRTAVAQTRSVAEALDEIGTIRPVTYAEVAFPTAGTIATVEVAVGDRVTTGQVLATLDPASLEAAVREAQASLDSAELALELALAGESVTVGGSGFAPVSLSSGTDSTADATSASLGTAAGGTTAAAVATVAAAFVPSAVITTPAGSAVPADSDSTPEPSRPDTPTGVDEELRALQQEVLDAQSQVSADLASAKETLESAKAVCSVLGAPADATDPADTVDDAGSADTGSDDQATTDPTGEITLCHESLTLALEAQSRLSASHEVLSSAVDRYSALVSELAADLDPATPTDPDGQDPDDTAAPPATPDPAPDGDTGAPASPTSPTSPTTPSTPGAGSGSPTTGESATSSIPSAERLIAYQAAIEESTAGLVVAQAALRAAAIVSPVDGTVVQVELTPGDDVEAASETAFIGIDADQGFEVTAIIDVADLPLLEVGQSATIIPDGASSTLEGEVVWIGLTSSSEGDGSTYPVTVSITDDSTEVRHGSVASLAIVLADAEDVVSVPTSAVHVDGGEHSVRVLSGTGVEEVAVEVGAVGAAWTEVRSGVSAGDAVVLADLDEPLPGSATTTDGAATTQFPGDGAGMPPGRGSR